MSSCVWNIRIVTSHVLLDTVWYSTRILQVKSKQSKQSVDIPSRKLTFPPDKAYLKMIFLFPRWDMLVPWRVPSLKLTVRPCKKVHPERRLHHPSINFQWLTLSFREGTTHGFFYQTVKALAIEIEGFDFSLIEGIRNSLEDDAITWEGYDELTWWKPTTSIDNRN